MLCSDLSGCWCRVVRPGPSGEWNLRGVRFFKPSTLTSYGIASFVPPTRVGHQGDPASIMVGPAVTCPESWVHSTTVPKSTL